MMIAHSHAIFYLFFLGVECLKLNQLSVNPIENGLTHREVSAMKANFKPHGLNTGELYRAQYDERGHVFIHVHKSMGTWMCAMANSQMPKLILPLADCSRPKDLPWGNYGSWDFFDKQNTCSARVEDQHVQHWDFQEIERWVDFQNDTGVGDWCPKEFSYSIIMRHPLDRIKSQMHANKQSWNMISLFTSHPHPGHSYFIQSYVPFDNFYTRVLGGRSAYLAEFGKVNDHHLEQAKKQLDQLDAVVDVENLLGDLIQIEELTGWKGLVDQSNHVVSDDSCHTCKEYDLSEEQDLILRKWNQIDEKLFQYSKKVAKAKTSAVVERLKKQQHNA